MPRQDFVPKSNITQTDKYIVGKKIQELLQIGAISPCNHCEGEFLSIFSDFKARG